MGREHVEDDMDDPVMHYHSLRLETVRKALVRNHFLAWVVATPADARRVFLEEILPGTETRVAAWGDSMTMEATGVLDDLAADPDIELIRTFEHGVPRPEIMERRRRALLADLFVTGTNAVTEQGELINLDGTGNRVSAMVFGPRHVVLFIGANKIVPDVAAGMQRIKEYAAPANAIRHDFATPCAKTGKCMDCNSPKRVCNTWTIMEKSRPEGRIKVVLIKQALGL